MPHGSPPHGCAGASVLRRGGRRTPLNSSARVAGARVRIPGLYLGTFPRYRRCILEAAPWSGLLGEAIMRAVIAAAVLLAVAPLASAQKTDVLVQRAKDCDAAVKGARLSEEQYRTYMRACLASTDRPQDIFESARQIERLCNTIANDRQLVAQDRVAFMESCRRKGG